MSLNRFITAALTAAILVVLSQRAFALSGIVEQQPQSGEQSQSAPQTAPSGSPLPMPEPILTPPQPTGDAAANPAPEQEPVNAEIVHDASKAPQPVRRMRELIVEAAASGDIERLRTLTNPGPAQTQITGAEGQDPVEAFKSFSGDPDGQEIMAIMLDILQTGYARLDAGTPEEVYVWPYFAGKSLASLTAPEKVELLRIITAGDLADMQEYGNYNFYRIGITPDGQWKFFTSGD